MANLQNLPGCTAPYSQCTQQSCNNNGTLATECSEIRNLNNVISQKDSAPVVPHSIPPAPKKKKK